MKIDLKRSNLQIHVPTPEISRKVQLELFKAGHKWPSGGHVQDTEYNYIQTWDDKKLTRSTSQCDRYIDISYQDIIGPSLPFQVGDKVRAFGCDGVVTYIAHDVTYPVRVTYIEGNIDSFTEDGKLHRFYKEPSLILVERPVKKVKKKFWLWADDKGEVTDLIADEQGNSPTFAHKYNMSTMTKIPGTEVTLEVEVSHV